MKMDDLLSESDNIGVASFGMHFSRHQYEELKRLGVEEIVFGFDRQFEEINDLEFSQLLKVFETIYNRFGHNEDGIKLSFILDTEKISGYKDSPVDCGLEVFTSLYRSRKTYEEIKAEYLTLWDSDYIDEEEEGDIYAY